MSDNTPARALTADELTAYRNGRSAIKLGLAIQPYNPIFSAQINQTFTAGVGVAELTYDNATGDYTKIVGGMTLYVGSAAGLYDKGIVRIRKNADANKLYIAETFDVNFADNDYVTVIDTFGVWARETRMVGDTLYMDYDVEYAAGLSNDIMACVGGTAAVVFLRDGIAHFAPPSAATNSRAVNLTSIASYAYVADGAINQTDMTTPTPSWDYNAAGLYRWQCTLQDVDGGSTTVYRWVFVSPPEREFELMSSVIGENNGWSFTVKMRNALPSDIPPRALCVLYAMDEDPASIGLLSWYENIIAVGWVDVETMTTSSDDNSVTFSVFSADYWLDKTRAAPLTLSNTSSASYRWDKIYTMTLDAAAAHVIQKRTTLNLVADVFMQEFGVVADVINDGANSALAQINSIGGMYFAELKCNHLGQAFFETDYQIYDGAIPDPDIMTITDADINDGVTVTVKTAHKIALVELNGIESYNGTARIDLYSRAPSINGGGYGTYVNHGNKIFLDQNDANQIAGRIYAKENSAHDSVDFSFAYHTRAFDVAPRQALLFNFDNPARGYALNSRRAIPRRIEHQFIDGIGRTFLSCEIETRSAAVDGVEYHPPTSQDANIETSIPSMPSVDFPSTDLGAYFPTTAPADDLTPCPDGVASVNSSWDKTELDGTDSNKLSAFAYQPCRVKNDSYIDITATFYGDAYSNVHVYGIKSGARVITASITKPSYLFGIRATFTPLSPIDVDGFEINIDAGIGADITYNAGSTAASGSFDAAASGGSADVTLPAGWYAIENNAGPWQTENVANPRMSYKFKISANNGASWSATYGYRQQTNGGDYVLEIGGVLPYETFGYVTRIFYELTSTTLRVAAGSTTFADNSGSMGFIIRNVTLSGRRVTLGTMTIINVCAAGT